MNKKLGYYTCGGLEFDSKIQAVLHSTNTKQPVEWIFNNETFNNFQWDQEPTESLDELYDQRARKIREQYDYVVLSYSGGSDSHNILMSFYRQGLRLDEVISNWNVEASKNYTILDNTITQAFNQNAEYELHVRARLQWIKDNMPETRVTFVDSSRDIIKFFQTTDESWVLNNSREPLNPAVLQRFNYLNLKEINLRVDRNKNIGIIIGVDKPRIEIQENKLHFYLLDSLSNITPIAPHFKDYDNTTIEYFYWAPESCAMLAKQCHTVFKFLDNNRPYRTIFNRQRDWTQRNFQEQFLRQILYSTTWDNSWFQIRKPINDWDCEMDNWFIDQFENKKPGNTWSAGLRYLEQTLDKSHFKTNTRGLRGFESPHYYVGTFSN